MRNSRANAYDTDWEYGRTKRQERKQTKKLREKRKSRRSQWEPVE